jgi:predicted  nucleic acid-binding Zn-ribbon protein
LLANFQLVSGSYGFDYGAGSGLWNSFLGGVKSAWDGLTYPVREHPGLAVGAVVAGAGGYGVYRGVKAYNGLVGQNKELYEKLRTQDERFNGLDSRIDTESGRIASLTSRVDNQDSEIRSVKGIVLEEGVKTRDQAREQFNALSGQHLLASSKLSNLEGSVNELKEQGEVVNGRLENLEEQGVRLQGTVENVQKGVSRVETQGNAAKDQLSQIEAGVSRLTSFLDSNSRQLGNGGGNSSQRGLINKQPALPSIQEIASVVTTDSRQKTFGGSVEMTDEDLKILFDSFNKSNK